MSLLGSCWWSLRNHGLQIGQEEIGLLVHDLKHAVFEAFELLIKYWLKHLHELLPVCVRLCLQVARDTLAFGCGDGELIILADNHCVIFLLVHRARGIWYLREVAYGLFTSAWRRNCGL